ncbi:MAG: hypothetical protein RIG26_09425 [Thalassospira sp.]|uniref:hypothetical protein n=1 Tax=Thalassospira sp. TaxID=1912094 RepID=UPI0032ECA130
MENKPRHKLSQSLYPLWLVSANLIARLGGMIILVMIGHAFASDMLGTYFSILALVGLAVTATQAGSGPLLIRFAQSNHYRSALGIVIIRLLIAVIATQIVMISTNQPLITYWPLILMPMAAALSPDWMIAARTEFSRLGAIAVIAQLAGISMAIWAVMFDHAIALFAIAPSISIAGLIASTVLAVNPSKPQPVFPPGHSSNQATTFGLIGFTLLAGCLPNLDFVLLGQDNDALFMAQRVFLFCAGLLAAIASTLFAKRQSGALRDVWLFFPMAAISLVLMIAPDQVAMLIYATPSPELIEVLQHGALWPLLLALLTRQILTLQEMQTAAWLGWACLVVLIATALLISPITAATDVIVFAQYRLGLLIVVLVAWSAITSKRRVSA